jgi:hypothetical protein
LAVFALLRRERCEGQRLLGIGVVPVREDAVRDVVADHPVLDALLVVGVEVRADDVA